MSHPLSPHDIGEIRRSFTTIVGNLVATSILPKYMDYIVIHVKTDGQEQPFTLNWGVPHEAWQAQLPVIVSAGDWVMEFYGVTQRDSRGIADMVDRLISPYKSRSLSSVGVSSSPQGQGS